MRLDGWTLALQTINFLVLVWLLRHFLYKPVLAVIARRQSEVERELQHAASVDNAAMAQRRDLDAQRAGIAAEHEKALADARAEAEAARGQILTKAKAERDRLAAEARQRLEHEREEAAVSLAERAAEVAVEIARRLLARSGAGTAATFLARICARIEALSETERAQLRSGGAVRLVSASPLTPEEAASCRRRLQDLLGDVEVDLADDPALLAGVELHFPHAVLRDNWRDSLAEIQRTLVSDAAARHA